MRSRMLFIFFIISSFGFRTPLAATAQAPATWQGEIDGVPVWITVVSRGHEISVPVQAREPWWRWGNTATDAYLFAVEHPDNVRLILDFREGPDGLPEVWLYINQMGLEPIDYSREGEKLTVHSNGGHPYLMMRPEGGGWFIEGKANYNLSLSVDGFIRGFGSDQAKTDGQIDASMRVGSSQPGRPDWQTLRLAEDQHPGWSYPRFVVRQRMPDAPLFQVNPPLIPSFPYFDMGADRIDWFEENPNPLYFHLNRSEFEIFPFPGFHTGGTYEVNSLVLPPYVDFESVFAFYNFDTSTRYAQLVVRAHSFPAKDPFGPEPRAIERSTFRYSWKTFDNTRWTYSLHFAGPYAYTRQVKVGDEVFWGSPSADLPDWVTSREWPITTFVEAVGGYVGSEGIYFYSAQSNTSWDWLGGMSEEPPAFLTEPFLSQTSKLTDVTAESLPVGFRGEYNDRYSRTAKLYLSPVDNLMHLLHAQGGIWNLGNGRILRMHNLDGDDYIDGWTREQVPAQSEEQLSENELKLPRALPGEAEESLYALDDLLIYSGADQVELRKVNYQPSSFEIFPPTDKASWRLFQESLSPYIQHTRDPNDLKSWLRPFRGNTLSIAGAQISNIRAIPNGFRFVLDLQPGYRFQDKELFDMEAFEPGRYVVTYTGWFAVEPITPPDLSISLMELTPTQLALSPIKITVRNDGLEDLPTATLELWATAPDGATSVIATQSIELLAQQSTTTTLLWAPAFSGTWSLTPKILQPNGDLSSGDSISIKVSPPESANTHTLLLNSTAPKAFPMILTGLIAFALLAAFVLWSAWRDV